MDVYASEEEQVEALKKWWKENGNAVLIGLLVGLGGLFGWNTWQARIHGQQEEASHAYQQLLSHVAGKEAKNARYIGDTLMTNHSDSPYAALSAMTLAKLEIDEGQPAAGRKHLEWVVSHSPIQAMQDTALVRLASLDLLDAKAEDALSRIGKVKHCQRMVSCMELKGDILLSLNRIDDARTAYLQAISKAESDKAELSILQLKLDDIGS